MGCCAVVSSASFLSSSCSFNCQGQAQNKWTSLFLVWQTKALSKWLLTHTLVYRCIVSKFSSGAKLTRRLRSLPLFACFVSSFSLLALFRSI